MNLIASYHLFITITSFLGLITAVFLGFRRKRAFSFVKEQLSFVKEGQDFAKEQQVFTKEGQDFVKEQPSFVKEQPSFVKEEQDFTKEQQDFMKVGEDFTKENLFGRVISIVMACNYGDRVQLPSTIELIRQ
jgi:hypothetical protein